MNRVRVTRALKTSEIQEMLDRNPNEVLVLEFNDTRSLDSNLVGYLMRLNGSNRLQIRIIGGYDDKRVADYPDHRRMHMDDNIYTLRELLEIYHEIEKIELGINPHWDDLQKLIYFIGYLKNSIIYHPFFETAPSKDIRSLRGLYSRQTVCAGFALILKELCDRNGIYCQYVEGCKTIEDINKGYLTHAWNIVKINGNMIPVDLTWNATANNNGKMLDNHNLFDVNEFVRTHVPGRKELIQDYKRDLKSIDGTKVSVLNSFINKDIKFENNSFRYRRPDGGSFEVTLVGQFIENNNVIYRYYYQGFGKDGTKGRPLILYSSSNISETLGSIKQIEKKRKQLVEARNRKDYNAIRRLEEELRPDKIQYLYDSRNLYGELMFSVENIKQAVLRGDNYIGGVITGYNKVGTMEAKGVYIDTSIGKKIGLKQKYCKRSDGSTFVIEDYGKLKINNSLEVYRYRIYESVMEKGKKVVIKNTIFTDQDLFTDTRQDLYDDFLSRSRLDRKNREANGYLGYYSREGVRTYSSPVRKYFNELCKRLVITSKDIKDYYKEISIFEMSRLVRTYEKVNINGKEVFRNRTTLRAVNDPDLELRIKFSYLWLFAAGTSYNERDFKGLYGYTQAFSSAAERVYKSLYNAIVKSMYTNGNIDPIQILMNVRKNGGTPEQESLVVRLFSSREAVQVINHLFRLQNPSALKESSDIDFFVSGRMSSAEALLNRRRNLEKARIILQVYKDNEGKINYRKM